MLQLTQSQRLQQKLSPAQVQYLKILQLPVLALEQRIKDELELNPLLEEGMDQEEIAEQTLDEIADEPVAVAETAEERTVEAETALDTVVESSREDYIEKEIRENREEEYSWEEFFEDNEGAATRNYYDSEDDMEIPTPATSTLAERLVTQLHMLELEPRYNILGEEVIGNLEDDGYLRRPLFEIVMDVNLEYDQTFTLDEAEELLMKIQRLEPPGVAARNLQECLLVQLEMMPNTSTARIIALRIIKECYDHFVKKHFEKIQQDLHITDDMLRKAFGLIKRLNPKPGEGIVTAGTNYIIPDFFVLREKDQFIITLNDSGVPPLRVSRAYRELLLNKKKKITTEARQFLRQKMENAKWFIQSIHQRRQTMFDVMQAIVEKQRDFFLHGPGHLRPMIYRDIAEIIRMDISTISRVVNGKYVQTEWGVYELRHFFSEGIPTASGIDVSNKEVKNIIKEIIEAEDPKNPLSDQAIMDILRKRGFDIARRTVAKYRENIGIPVSRLRTRIA